MKKKFVKKGKKMGSFLLTPKKVKVSSVTDSLPPKQKAVIGFTYPIVCYLLSTPKPKSNE